MLAAYGEYDKFMKALKNNSNDLDTQVRNLKRKRRQRQKRRVVEVDQRASPDFSPANDQIVGGG